MSLLERGVPVGLRTNIFWLTYFPTGIPPPVQRPQLDRRRAQRSAVHDQRSCAAGAGELPGGGPDPREVRPRSIVAPGNALSTHEKSLLVPQLRKAILAGIRDCSSAMLNTRVPWCGIKGIGHLARRIRAWPRTLGGNQEIKLHAGHIIRMQEEVGTGGSGFRYMYAAFLQEAGQCLDHEPFAEASRRMTEVGDAWRSFAVNCGRVIKGRDQGRITCDTLADELVACAEREREVFLYLRNNLPRVS